MRLLNDTQTKFFSVLCSAALLSSCSEKKEVSRDAEPTNTSKREVRDRLYESSYGSSGQTQFRVVDIEPVDLGGLEDLLPSGLVPVETASEEEIKFLEKQLLLFKENPESTLALEEYIERYPEGAFALTLRNSLSSIYYQQGRLSEVLENAKSAWKLGSSSESSTAQYLADKAYGDYSRSLSFFGLREELRALIESVEGRAPAGFASLSYLHAKESLASMERNTESSHLCGPHALYCINLERGGENPQAPLESPKAVSSEKGMNFAQVQQIANDLNMGLTVAKSNQAEDVPVPSIISWKLGHFSAVTERLPSGKLKVEDTMFSQPLLIEPSTLIEESSGYFMVPTDQLSDQWVQATEEEAASVWGAHTPVVPNPDDKPDCPENCGMAGWSVDKLHIDLGISDTPLVYQPAFGPSVSPRLSFKFFTTRQGSTFNHSNIGLKWNLNWISYVQDNPTQPEAAVVEYRPNGGGARIHQQVVETAEDGSTSMAFQRDKRNQSLVERLSDGSYQISGSDGSRRIYDVSDGGAVQRKFFCSQYIDPQGHSLTYNYDEQLRLTSLTDATGKQTTLSYEHEDPLKITAITDPYGRIARLDYNASGYLEK